MYTDQDDNTMTTVSLQYTEAGEMSST